MDNMDYRSQLIELCEKRISELNLGAEHRARFKTELQDIDNQNEYEYLIEVYSRGYKGLENENNMFIAYLLGICDSFDLSKPPAYSQGEMPDVDVDYIGPVRDYLKNVWAPQTFGEDRVCNIANYGTFGIKSSLIDMTRVFNEDRNEILKCTKPLGLKDEDGEDLTWHAALEISPDLKNFCNKHPDIAEAAQGMISRYRGRGKHAGGLIVSNRPLDELVPLVTDEDDNPVSAWTEGQHSQDLGPVGLIKFDLLSLNNLMQIAIACKLVKERHGLSSICALPGQKDWSDTSYLNDPKVLELANSGRLQCIFQFNSKGMREMVKRGGVDSFEDLVAYTALYRPGPLGMHMDKHYIDRKNGREEYAIHPLLKPALEKTYGILCYQEQIAKILNIVGKIPLKDCEIIRKAISKKKLKDFIKYKAMFVENGQKVLGWTEAEVMNLWEQVEKFAGYGFNRSHSVEYTFISCRLLWLKAHYPIEFFTAIMSCEDKDDKLMEYKLDAESFGLKVNRVDLNKSKAKFAIIDDEIYTGFANIKGIGDAPGQKIVENQPYNSLDEFMTKYGAEANVSVLKPLVGLGVLERFESDRVKLWEFIDYYKDTMTKRDSRMKRNKDRRDQYLAEIASLEEVIEHDIGVKEEILDLRKRYEKCVTDYEQKVNNDQPILYQNFVPKGKIDAKLAEVYQQDLLFAEQKYYGFGWEHILTKSPDFVPDHDFSRFEEEGLEKASIICQVVDKPRKKTSKKGVVYYTIKIQDCMWRENYMTVWQDDYERFKEEFELWDSDALKGNLLKIVVRGPSSEFGSFTFDSPQRHMRRYLPAKERDGRLFVLRKIRMDKHE